MGTPGFIRFKKEDGSTAVVPVEKARSWMERQQGRVTTERPLDELIQEQYGPMEPGDGGGELPAAPAPNERTVDAPSIANPPKLPIQKPVPPQPYFPPKDSASSATLIDEPGDEPGADDTGEPMRGRPVAAAPVDPEAAKRLEDSRKAYADTLSDQDLDRDAQTVGQGVHSPLKVPRFSPEESARRNYLDQSGFGTGDEAAGLGGVADEIARTTGDVPENKFVDNLLRYFGNDIPMRVDRKVLDDKGNEVRDKEGNDTIATSMEYGSSASGHRHWGDEAVNNPEALKRAAQHHRGAPVATQMRELAPRMAGPGVDAPEEDPGDRGFLGVPAGAYEEPYSGSSGQYLEDEKRAQAENPVSYAAGGFAAGIPQSFLLRLFGSPARIKEAVQAAERAGPTLAKFGERVAAGAMDALKNPGNITSSILSGLGHSEGDTATERLVHAGEGAAMEHVVGAALAGPAEAALGGPRGYGRSTHAKFTSELHSPEVAPTLVPAEQAGTGLEAFAKRTDAPGYGLTSEMGVRPSAELHAAQQAALRPAAQEAKPLHPVLQAEADDPGQALRLSLSPAENASGMERRRISAEPGQELRARAAESLTNAAENQRVKTVEWIRREKDKYFASPEGQQEIPLSAVMEHFPDAPELRARLLRKFRPAPYQPPRQFHEEPIDPDRVWPGERTPSQRHLPRPPVPERMINAEELDAAIQFADTHGKSWTGKIEHADLPSSFKAYADYLRDQVRNEHYKGLQAIDDNAHKYLGQWEANVSAIGIDPRTSPVKIELHNEHTQQVYNRLGEFKDQPLMRDAADDLAQFGADVKLIEQAEALAAQRKLVTDQQKGAGPGRYGLGKFYSKLNLIDPGLRAAGLENLGLNAQGAVRGGMAAPVNDYIYKLLGKQPNQSSEEDQR